MGFDGIKYFYPRTKRTNIRLTGSNDMAVKTVSLETAKLLKEAGFRQEGGWYWTQHKVDTKNCILNLGKFNPDGCFHNFYAPTTDELLEELPYRINYQSHWGYLSIDKTNTPEYIVGYRGEGHKTLWAKEIGTLPEALARMWLWLKKEGLL